MQEEGRQGSVVCARTESRNQTAEMFASLGPPSPAIRVTKPTNTMGRGSPQTIPSAAACFSRPRSEGDVGYKPMRCGVLVRAMHSTSGADAEYKLRHPSTNAEIRTCCRPIFFDMRRRPLRTLPRPSFSHIHMYLQRACVRHEQPLDNDSRCRRHPSRCGSRPDRSRAT